MMSRFALAFSFLAIAATAGSLILIGNKVIHLGRRIDELEKRPLPAPPPPPAPPAPAPEKPDPDDPAVKLELEREKVRGLAERENQIHFAALARKLELKPELEAKVREAFADEFAYYAAGIVRGFESLRSADPKAQENYLASPEFRKGLEKCVAATDEKVRELLTVFETAVFEQWRRDMRKERYELD